MIKKILQRLFKKISYEIFFKIYGKIERSIDCNNDKRIKIETVNIDKDLTYRIFNITDGRLYTDRIHDTAILLDNKIIEEPSFQLRYKGPFIHNSNIKDNIVFKKGTPRKLKILDGTVLSLLTGGGANTNYWHWLFDVLPKLSICNETFDLKNVDYFLLPDDIKKFQIETLNYLGIPKNKRLSSKRFRHIKAKKLIITDHPVVISEDPTKDIMNMPMWISKWLKAKFINQIVKKDIKKMKKIYIDRDDSKSNQPSVRSISNEDEIKKYFSKKNFISVKLHELEFIDQVQLFYNAECIVGLHGGGFANIVFCKPKTKIIELRGAHAGNPIENLAKKNDLNYDSIIVKAKQSSPNQQGAINIPVDKLNELLINFKSHSDSNK